MDELNDLFEEGSSLDNVEQTNILEQEEPLIDNGDLFEGLEQENTVKNKSILDEFLELKGITNGKVKIIDEENNESLLDFYDLTKEEQLLILNEKEEPENNVEYVLEENEISLINAIREKNITVEEYLEEYKKSVLEEAGLNTETYNIDVYDDNELFLLDLKQKYDLSDEELARELEKELKDETLFKKKVDILRREYKILEDQYKTAQLQELEAKKLEEFETFSQNMVDIAISTPEFHGIELEDDEKNEILSFLLDADDNGVSEFQKTLNDPVKLYEAAWFLRYGKESFEALKNAYESEISKLKKQDTTKVIHRNTGKKQDSIYDLI